MRIKNVMYKIIIVFDIIYFKCYYDICKFHYIFADQGNYNVAVTSVLYGSWWV